MTDDARPACGAPSNLGCRVDRFAPSPVASFMLDGDERSLMDQIWPDLREQLIRWHLTGAAQLFRGGVLVDPVVLRTCQELIGLEWRIYDPIVAARARAFYGDDDGRNYAAP